MQSMNTYISFEMNISPAQKLYTDSVKSRQIGTIDKYT